MDADKEKMAVEEVAETLSAKFPEVDREHVEEVVQGEYDALAGARVRDYIPALVENESRNDLLNESHAEAGDESAGRSEG